MLKHLEWLKKIKTGKLSKIKASKPKSPQKITSVKSILSGESPFCRGGTIPLLNKSYVLRESELELKSLFHEHKFLYIHGKRQFGKSSLLSRHANWISQDWRVAYPSLAWCNGTDREAFVKDFLEELKENFDETIENWRAIKTIIKKDKVVFLIDEIGNCCDKHVAPLLIEKLYRFYEESPNNVKIVIAYIEPIKDYLKSIKIKNQKYYEHWQTIELIPFTIEEAEKLLRFFPQEIEKMLKQKMPLIAQATALEPVKVQKLLHSIWVEISKADVNCSSDFLEQIIKEYIENGK